MIWQQINYVLLLIQKKNLISIAGGGDTIAAINKNINLLSN